jgi:tetratricopeptide (TPR) repeat protein
MAEENGKSQAQGEKAPAAAPDGKGKPFFDRANQVAESGNWDFAIEMLLLGIAKEPENLLRGHHRLREVAMQRKMSGGKPAGFMGKMKRKSTKDPMESLINAEWLMSRDPSDPTSWKQIILAAQWGGWKDVVEWAGGALYDINRMTPKPSKEIYLFLRDVYTQVELFGEAVRACQAAATLAPNDPTLHDSLRDLSARATIQKGKYDQGGSFTDSVKDLKGQMEAVRGQGLSQNEQFLLEQVVKTKVVYVADPSVPGKIIAYVDALAKLDEDGYENEAIDVLTKAFKELGTYRYKVRMGDIRIKQMKRRREKLRAVGDKEAASKAAKELLAFELAEYTERAANYPTDLGIKFELGVRQFQAGQYDDAISTLQQARRDPKHRLAAMHALGMAFFKKAWYTEAAETFQTALDSGDVPEKRRIELMYDLGLCHEATGNAVEAIARYSDVAQLDFNYRDVRERIEKLRAKAEQDKGETPQG